MLRTPSGSPASAKISPQSSPPTNGDSSDGLATTVLPSASGAARAGGQDQGGVPGEDGADHPDRPAQPHGHGPGQVGGEDLADRAVGQGGRLAQQAGHEAHLEHPEPVGDAAGLAGQQADDLVGAALQDVGGGQEDPLALGRRRLRPGREGGLGGLDGPPGVLAGAGGDRGHDLARVRVEVLEGRPAAGAGPLAPDELPVLGGGHLRPPGSIGAASPTRPRQRGSYRVLRSRPWGPGGAGASTAVLLGAAGAGRRGRRRRGGGRRQRADHRAVGRGPGRRRRRRPGRRGDRLRLRQPAAPRHLPRRARAGPGRPGPGLLAQRPRPRSR